jgi:hypothetical protein
MRKNILYTCGERFANQSKVSLFFNNSPLPPSKQFPLLLLRVKPTYSIQVWAHFITKTQGKVEQDLLQS